MRHAVVIRTRIAAWSLAVVTAGCAPPAPRIAPGLAAPSPDSTRSAAADTTPPRGARFYRSRAYGTERQFNPLSLVINGGLDQLRTEGANTHVFELQYGRMAQNVVRSLVNTERVLRAYGWNRWMRFELLPMSTKTGGGGQWVPNYQLHLLGGGMTGVRMTEWYTQRGCRHPEWAAAGTVYAWHFLTEMVEHGTNKRSADAITDLLIFDSAAFLLWRTERVQRFVVRHVEMTNWPGQPTIVLPDRTIENVHMAAMLRTRLPGTTEWRAMTTFGAAFLVGVSRRAPNGDWMSLALGADPIDNPVIDPETGRKSVVLKPQASIFWDRDGSLLATLGARGGRTEILTLNVYPGVFRVGGYAPGVWAQWLRTGQLRFGVATELGPGLGVGPR